MSRAMSCIDLVTLVLLSRVERIMAVIMSEGFKGGVSAHTASPST
jgi:hypothetical protein